MLKEDVVKHMKERKKNGRKNVYLDKRKKNQ